MSHFRYLVSRQRFFLVAAFAFIFLIFWHFVLAPVSGDRLGNRVLQIGSNQIQATTDYNLSFDIVSPGTLGSIVAEFCSNDPLFTSPCTTPIGMDVSQANMVSQSGPGGFSVSGASTANTLILSRTPAVTPVTNVSFHFDNMVNPSNAGSYFVRVKTYSTADATGAASDYGGIAFAITELIAVTAEVPPYLAFCTGISITGLNCANASGDYIDFGELSSKKTSHGSSQMLVATNAEQGYAITAGGTTLTSGNNTIPPLFTGDISRPGVGQFGFNLTANTTPAEGNNPVGPGVSFPKPEYNQQNVFRFVNGETIVSNTVPEDVRQYTSSYIVNVPASQAAGVYVTTVTYVCLANF